MKCITIHDLARLDGPGFRESAVEWDSRCRDGRWRAGHNTPSAVPLPRFVRVGCQQGEDRGLRSGDHPPEDVVDYRAGLNFPGLNFQRGYHGEV
jgi:hypothetical protein